MHDLPLFSPPPPPADDALATLRDVFGHGAFLPGQGEAVRASLEGRHAVVLLPTGGGKSACYQVPAVLRRRRGGGPTLVVSPLIALMEDQLSGLRARGVSAVALHSSMPWDEIRAARREAGEATLIYASPERCKQKRFRGWLADLGVSAVAVDEAHCISEWGHDFRPDYLALGDLVDALEVPVMAVTATATPRVLEEVATSLHLADPVVVRGEVARPELTWSVELHQGHKARDDRLVALLREAGFSRKGAPGRALVYAATRKRVVEVARALRQARVPAGHYHAGRTDGARQNAAAAYDEGRKPVLVATSAFGMGVDHPDVRLVVHVQSPGSLEAYVQEAGRAGRDRRPARCVLLYSAGDAHTWARLRGKTPWPGAEAGFASLQGYAYGTGCREAAIVAHFTGAPAPRCGRCDACVDPATVVGQVERARLAIHARRAEVAARQAREDAVCLDEAQLAAVVTFVDALVKPVGRRLVAQGLRGSRARRVLRKKLDANPHYGALRGVPEAAVFRAIDALLEEGRLVPKGRKYPTLWIPDKRVRPKRAPRTRPAPAEPTLRAALRAWRRKEARRRRWKAYQVFPDKTLDALVQLRPTTPAELVGVPGLGPKRLASFSEAILRICGEYAA